MQDIVEQITSDLQEHRIVLYMKGSKEQPLCGFSARVVAILNEYSVPYETRNILENATLRAAIKEYSQWPTLPQLYVDREFVGGCDIVTELHQTGDLKTLLCT